MLTVYDVVITVPAPVKPYLVDNLGKQVTQGRHAAPLAWLGQPGTRPLAEGGEGRGGVLITMNDRSRMTIDQGLGQA